MGTDSQKFFGELCHCHNATMDLGLQIMAYVLQKIFFRIVEKKNSSRKVGLWWKLEFIMEQVVQSKKQGFARQKF